MTFIWVLAVLGGELTRLFTRLFVAENLDSTLDAQRADVQRVTAVLTADTPTRTPLSEGPDDGRVLASVRWTDHRGVKHIAKTLVATGRQVGSTVVIWTDGHGVLVSAPPTATAATQ